MTRRPGTTTPAMLRRSLGAHRAPLLAIATLTVVLAFVGVLTPQLTVALLTRGLRYDVDQSTALQHDLTAKFVGAPDDWASLAADLRAVHDAMPPLLATASGAAESASTTASMSIDEFPGGLQESYLALGASPQLFSSVRIVAGSAPTAVSSSGSALPMALSSSTARALHWTVGSTHTVQLADGGAQRVTLTGTFVARDRSADFWGHVSQALDPEITVSGTGGRIPIGTGWVAPASLPVLAQTAGYSDTGGLATAAWFPLGTSTLSGDDAEPLADASRHFTAIRRSVPSAGDAPLSFSTQLGDVIDSSRSRSATATALIDASLVGPLGAAVALELLACRLAIARARDALALIGARGAGRGGLRSIVAGLVGVLSLPAAVVGAGLGLVAARAVAESLGVPSPGVGPEVVVSLLLAAVVPAALSAVQLPRLIERPRSFPVRIVAETVLAAVAIVSIVLVARQGLSTASASGGADPVAAGLPLVLALCGCAAALRLLPRVLERLRRRWARGRGVAASTGLAVASRSRSGLGAPLLAVTAGLSVALFTSVIGSTLQHGLDDAARAQVGGDVRVATSGVDFTTELPFARVAGVARVAFVSDNASATITAGPRSVTASVVVVDSADLRAVQVGVPDAVSLPGALTTRSRAGIPIVVSRTIADRLGGYRPEFGGTRLDVVGRGPDVTSLVTGSAWILVDQRFASELSADNAAPDQTLLRLSPSAEPARVADRVSTLVGSGAAVTTADAVRSSLQQNPLVPGLRLVALEASALGGLLGAAALVTTVLLDSGPRRRRIRLLTLIGLDRFQRRRLVLAETLPLGVAALASGVVVAAAMVAFVLPSADLRSFTGGSTRPPIHLDLVGLAALVVAGAAVVALVSLLAVRLGGRLITDRPDTEDAE